MVMKVILRIVPEIGLFVKSDWTTKYARFLTSGYGHIENQHYKGLIIHVRFLLLMSYLLSPLKMGVSSDQIKMGDIS